MGRRGKIKEYGDRVPVRFRPGQTVELQVLAAMWSVSVPEVVRIFVTEGLRNSGASRGEANEPTD